MSKTEIWCLFSIENNYDQPDNNLECWWQIKPSIDTLSKAINGRPLGELTNDETILNTCKIFSGSQVQITSGETAYRLEKVEEGKIL